MHLRSLATAGVNATDAMARYYAYYTADAASRGFDSYVDNATRGFLEVYISRWRVSPHSNASK